MDEKKTEPSSATPSVHPASKAPAEKGPEPMPATASPDAPKGITVAELQQKIETVQAVQKTVKPRKPFPWPFFLVWLVPVTVGVALVLTWREEMIRSLRIGWIALWSVLPGFAALAALGSLAQMRRRPIFSFLSFILACGVMAFCWWTIQFITTLQLLD